MQDNPHQKTHKKWPKTSQCFEFTFLVSIVRPAPSSIKNSGDSRLLWSRCQKRWTKIRLESDCVWCVYVCVTQVNCWNLSINRASGVDLSSYLMPGWIAKSGSRWKIDLTFVTLYGLGIDKVGNHNSQTCKWQFMCQICFINYASLGWEHELKRRDMNNGSSCFKRDYGRACITMCMALQVSNWIERKTFPATAESVKRKGLFENYWSEQFTESI